MSDYYEIYLRNSYKVEFSAYRSFTFSLIDFEDHPFFDNGESFTTSPIAVSGTASDPGNQPLSAEENRARNRQLYNELNSSYMLLPAQGCYKEHCEEGYLVYAITLEEALKRGREHGQFAVFYNSGKELLYIKCEDKSVIVKKERQAQ